MPKPILFDLDDTLLDRHATVWQYVRDQYERLGLHHLPYDAYCSRFIEADAHGYHDRPTVFKMLSAEFDLRATVDALVEDFGQHAWQECFIYPDTLSTLEALRARGHKLGIVTNGSTEYQRTKLKTPGLADLFDLIMVSGEVGLKKPDAAIYELAASQLGVPPSECIFVGDNPETDIVGAHNVGMTTVWVKRIMAWPEAYNWQPDYTINSLAELLALPGG